MSDEAITLETLESSPENSPLEEYFSSITRGIQTTLQVTPMREGSNEWRIDNIILVGPNGQDVDQLKTCYANLIEAEEISIQNAPALFNALIINYYSACLIAPAVHAWTAQVKRDYLAIPSHSKKLVVINRENSPFEYLIGKQSWLGKRAISLDLRNASLSNRAVQHGVIESLGGIEHIVLVDPSPYGNADLLAKLLPKSQIIPRHFIFAGGMEISNRVHMDEHKSFVPLNGMSGLDISTTMRLIEQGTRNSNPRIQEALNEASKLGYQSYIDQLIPAVMVGKLRGMGVNRLINTILNIKVLLDQNFFNNQR